MALTPTETIVLNLWESGRSIEQIVETAELTKKAVCKILSVFCVVSHEDRLDRTAAKAGSERYIEALVATGKVYA